MPKRGKDKKKKKKSKDRASSSGGELTLLVGKQGLNAPRAASLFSDETRQLALRDPGRGSLNLEGNVLNLEGNDLNADVDALNLASSDEAAWQFFGEGLLQSDEDELMPGNPGAQTGLATEEMESASAPLSLMSLGRAIASTKIQVEAHGFHRATRLEEGGDKDPDYEVRYDGDTSEDSGTGATGLDLNPPSEITSGNDECCESYSVLLVGTVMYYTTLVR